MMKIKLPLLGVAIAIGIAGITPNAAEAHSANTCRNKEQNKCLAGVQAVRECRRQAEIVCYRHVHDGGMESFTGSVKPDTPLRAKGPRPLSAPVQ